MSMISGGCQCGAVRFEVSAPPFVAYTCHCRECQRLSSSAFTTCAQFPAESVNIIQGDTRTRVRDTDSGNRLTGWFCPSCGSTVFLQNSARPRIRTVFTGTLDEPETMPVSAHIWMDRAMPWFVVPEGHRTFPRGADWTEDYKDDLERYLGE